LLQAHCWLLGVPVDRVEVGESLSACESFKSAVKLSQLRVKVRRERPADHIENNVVGIALAVFVCVLRPNASGCRDVFL
jgi:hypothetical protein